MLCNLEATSHVTLMDDKTNFALNIIHVNENIEKNI